MTISKGATDTERFRRPALFYGSAREAFGDFLDQPPSHPADAVLLPSFIGWSPREGSGVFDPVRQREIPAEFYALNRDLTADPSDVERRLASGRYRGLVLIHYYGRTDPSLAEVRNLATRYGVPLIEDNAHAFFSAAGGGIAGSMGDVALYSLHKMFPIPDGGMAIYRRGGDVQNLLTTRPDLAQEVLSYDWSAISLARRENFTVATQLLREARDRGAPLELVWPDLHADDVPQSLPIYVLPPTRDRIYELMNAAGYGVVSLYHTLIPELRSGFPVSAWAAEHILNVPVHQDVQPGRLVELIQTLERLLTELASD